MASPGYLYYPGCSLKSTGAAYEASLLALFRALDLPLEELDDWNCCGATSYMSIEEGSAFAFSARNLSLAKKAGGRDLLTPCNACYLVLKKTQDYAQQYPAVRAAIDRSLQRAKLGPIDGVRVRHPLEALYNDVGVEQIKSRVVRHWKGGRVACYYGCQAVRPYDEVDTPHNPMRMDELLQAAGIPTVEYPLKTKCCGGSLTGTMPDVGLRLNYILLKEAARKGAEAMVVICPLCQFNLDVYQAEMHGAERFDMPVVYLPQLLGWALGAKTKDLAFNKSVSGRELLRRWTATADEEVEAYV